MVITNLNELMFAVDTRSWYREMLSNGDNGSTAKEVVANYNKIIGDLESDILDAGYCPECGNKLSFVYNNKERRFEYYCKMSNLHKEVK